MRGALTRRARGALGQRILVVGGVGSGISAADRLWRVSRRTGPRERGAELKLKIPRPWLGDGAAAGREATRSRSPADTAAGQNEAGGAHPEAGDDPTRSGPLRVPENSDPGMGDGERLEAVVGVVLRDTVVKRELRGLDPALDGAGEDAAIGDSRSLEGAHRDCVSRVRRATIFGKIKGLSALFLAGAGDGEGPQVGGSAEVETKSGVTVAAAAGEAENPKSRPMIMVNFLGAEAGAGAGAGAEVGAGAEPGDEASNSTDLARETRSARNPNSGCGSLENEYVAPAISREMSWESFGIGDTRGLQGTSYPSTGMWMKDSHLFEILVGLHLSHREPVPDILREEPAQEFDGGSVDLFVLGEHQRSMHHIVPYLLHARGIIPEWELVVCQDLHPMSK
ncbi:hypothetical protein BD779DRAFT_856000 [Infundibulicybe gibba]|nr:hypothetical protein BD779DRAFT_856000 [Infundibulicybe gibba]